jgi:ParE toxin of type II toxin-antitoxin system, parDE
VRILLHPEADSEFAAEVYYYDRKESGLGDRFYREVIGCFDWISENPTVARLRENYRRVNLKVFPFYVAYVVEEDLIWVLAVAQANQMPGYWMHRLQK